MSRLLENSEQIREELEARNLYTPNDPYNLDNRQVVNTINGLVGVLKPFTSFDLTNTVIGRLIGPNTPIAQIGLQMLAKQFAATVASNASADFLPAIKFNNLFDGDPDTKFIMRKKDFQITRRENQTNLGRILDSISGVQDYFNTGNPFNVDVDSAQYIRNSGKGQMQILVENISKNLYKTEQDSITNALEEKGLQVSLGDDQFVNRLVFPFPDKKFYPFKQYDTGFQTIGVANDNFNATEREYLRGARADNGLKEYGNNEEYLNNLGSTSFNLNSSGSDSFDFNSADFGLVDGPENKLVWGRDGTSSRYDSESGGLREDDDPENKYRRVNNWNSFSANTGLLSYTRQLLNSKGRYGSFDLTRKKFQDTNGNIHFNGSPLDTEPDGTINHSRRHSALDPYDRYAKAIRFDGNEIYNGPADSVIFKSVIPKFAPSLTRTALGGVIDNRNLMFSIENLAVQTNIGEAGVGYLNDEMRTPIPACEVGPNKGRLMWFPPYDIRLNETAAARWNSNEFIGRGEPIYTYNSSERLASLSFKLLVDYPQHLLQYKSLGETEFHKKVAEFFAFGGDPVPEFDSSLSQKEALLTVKQNELEELEPITRLVDPNITVPTDQTFYFPNDYPQSATDDPFDVSVSESSSVEYIINGIGYEDGNNLGDEEIDGKDNGLNKKFLKNYSGDTTIIDEYFNPDSSNAYNENGEPYLKIAIEAGATVLFNPTENQELFNKRLSERRQLAVKEYLEDLILSKYNKTAEQLKIEINIDRNLAKGSEGSNPAFNTAETIPLKAAKEERYAKIIVSRTNAMVTKEKEIVGFQVEKRKQLLAEIASLESEINNIKRRMVEYSPCLFELPNEEQGYEKGFRSHFNNRFYPTFNSQTPEDLHRRLTFLHQCTRQGPAIRVTNIINGEEVQSSKNAVFGRQPVCVLRFGDFFHTKIVIDQVSFDYSESTWDMNPEGFGMQPMIVEVQLQMKIIGGQSLRTPIEALQNAVSFNYYANSTFVKSGMYATPTSVEEAQIVANGPGGGLTEEDQRRLATVKKEGSLTLPEIQRKGVAGIGPPAPPSIL
jgi:hypothetical protein